MQAITLTAISNTHGPKACQANLKRDKSTQSCRWLSTKFTITHNGSWTKLTTAAESQVPHAKPVLRVRRVLVPSSSSPWSVRGVDWLSSTCSTVFRWPKQHRQFCSACSMRWSTGAPHQSKSGWPEARGDHSVHWLTISTLTIQYICWQSPPLLALLVPSSHDMRMCVCVYTGTVQNKLTCEYANTKHNSSSFHRHTHEQPHTTSHTIWEPRNDCARSGYAAHLFYVQQPNFFATSAASYDTHIHS